MYKELQLIVTTKCSLSCQHCENENIKNNIKDLLLADDYVFLVETINKIYNYERVSVMGGDPFVRNDIEDIITKLKELDINLNVCTNGTIINKHMDIIKQLDSITISIKTLNESKYNTYIGRNTYKIDKLLANLLSIRNQNNKINIDFTTKIVKGLNDCNEEIKEIINLSKKMKANIYIKELVSNNKKDIVSIKEIINILKTHDYVIESNNNKETILKNNNKIFINKNFCINDETNNYCTDSNSIAIYPNGKIKTCMYNNSSVSLLDEIKNRDFDALTSKIIMANNLTNKKCNLNKKNQNLAINGGKPIINPGKGKYIYPRITKDLEKAIIDELNSTTSISRQFINMFTKYFNKQYGVLTNSSNTAFLSLLKSLNLKITDEVIIPAYISGLNMSAIFHAYAIPVVVDTNENGNIDSNKIEEKINHNTKVIIVSHNYGYASEINKIRNLADKYNIYLIEDCIDAVGGTYKNQLLGTFGDASVFSLNSNILAGQEGGIIITNNKQLYRNLLLFNHQPKTLNELINEKSTDYQFINFGAGLNIKCNPYNFRLAYECFPNINKQHRVRKFYAGIITKAVEEIDGLEVLTPIENSVNSWDNIIIKYNPKKFNNTQIENFIDALHQEGAIEFKQTYNNYNITELSLFQKPNYFFKNYSEQQFNCPIANEFSKSTIRLPIWYDEEDINLIFDYCEALKKVASYYQKRREL